MYNVIVHIIVCEINYCNNRQHKYTTFRVRKAVLGENNYFPSFITYFKLYIFSFLLLVHIIAQYEVAVQSTSSWLAVIEEVTSDGLVM